MALQKRLKTENTLSRLGFLSVLRFAVVFGYRGLKKPFLILKNVGAYLKALYLLTPKRLLVKEPITKAEIIWHLES